VTNLAHAYAWPSFAPNRTSLKASVFISASTCFQQHLYSFLIIRRLNSDRANITCIMFTRVQLLSSVILGVSLVLCCIVTKYIIGETNLAFRACGELSQALQGQVSYLKHSAYATSLQSHYSNQAAELSPACIIRPKTSQDVSILVKTLSSLNRSGNNAYRFAIRSGGHTPWAGSASIHNGVTIDLSALSNVVVGPDSRIASIGPGARWENVYRELDVLKLTVPGGRSGGVGVGGYLLGG
jgi:hypothetical protein